MSTVTNNIRNLVFSFFLIFFVFSVLEVELNFMDKNIYLILASFASLFVSFQILRFMFKPTKIQGLDRTYVVGPDLGIIREENIHMQDAPPEEAICVFCQREVYKPFRCVNCHQLFCGVHMLPSDHKCPKL